MADAIPFVQVMRDIRSADSYKLLNDIRGYVTAHNRNYGEQTDALLEALDDRYERLFNPMKCSEIRGLYIITPSGTRVNENRRAISFCEDAKRNGVTFIDYLKGLYPDAIDYVVSVWTPTEAESELVAMVTRGERTTPKAGGMVTSFNPNTATLARLEEMIEMLSDQVNKLTTQTLTPEVNDRIRRLEASMTALNDILEKRLQNERQLQMREKTANFNSQEYQYALRRLPSLGLPITTEQIERGRYGITFTYSPEDEAKVDAFINDVRQNAPKPTATGRTNPPGYDEILDLLCRKFTRDTGLQCGLSRNALGTLTRNLLEYAGSRHMDWQQLNAGDINLFPGGAPQIAKVRERRVYGSEMADEALRAFIAMKEGSAVARSVMTEEQGGLCSDESIANAIEKFDVYSVLVNENLNATFMQKEFDEAVNILRKCGYYPGNLEAARDVLAVNLAEYGADYDEYMAAAVKAAREKAGGAA